MASEFLKNQASKRAKAVEKANGSTAYGSSSWLRKQAERQAQREAAKNIPLPSFSELKSSSLGMLQDQKENREKMLGTVSQGESMGRFNFDGDRGGTATREGFGQEFDAGEYAAGIVEKGVHQIAKAGSSTLAFAEGLITKPIDYVLSGGKDYSLTENAPFHKWNEDINRNIEEAEKKYARNVAAGGKLAGLAEDLGVATVAAVPQAAAAMLTGGASAAEKGIQVARNAPGIFSTLRAAVSSTAKNPMFWSSYFQTVGNEYETAKADGTGEVAATLYALSAGAMNAAVEIGGGIETLPTELQGNRFTVKKWIESMVDEGREEVVQGIISRASQNLLYSKDNPLISTTDPNAVLNPVTAAQEFVGGAVVGGILGGAQGVTANLLNGGAQVAENPEVKNVVQQAVDKAQTVSYDKNVKTEEATVLNRGATLYTQLGMKLKKAEAKAAVVQKLIDGKEVTGGELLSLNLSDGKYQSIFTELTGVEFPQGVKMNDDQRFNLARTAHEVATARAQAEKVVEAVLEPVEASSGVEVAEDTTELRDGERGVQVAAETAELRDPDNGPADYEHFAQAYRETVKADAADAEIQASYDGYLADARTIRTSRGSVTRAEFRAIMRKTEKGAGMTDAQLNAFFDYALEREGQGGEPMFNMADDGGLAKYKSSESYKINAALRARQGVVPAEFEELDAAILSDLEELPAYTSTVYRNISFDLEGEEAFRAFADAHEVGAVVPDFGYVSASKSPDGYPVEGELVVQMTIHGETGRDISELYGLPEEQEILFHRGTEFRVDGKEFDGSVLRLTMTEVNDGTLRQQGTESDGGRLLQDDRQPEPDGGRGTGPSESQQRRVEEPGQGGESRVLEGAAPVRENTDPESKPEGVSEDGTQNQSGDLERDDSRAEGEGTAAPGRDGARDSDSREGRGRRDVRNARERIQGASEDQSAGRELNRVPEGAAETTRSAEAPSSIAQSFHSWEGAYLYLDGQGLNMTFEYPPHQARLFGEITVGYNDGGKWVDLGVYDLDAEGLEQFKADFAGFVAQSDPGFAAGAKVETVTKTIKGESYDVLADPATAGFEKAINDAKRVGMTLDVVNEKHSFRKADGTLVAGFADPGGQILTTNDLKSADHEVMHGYLYADHDFRNKLVRGMETKGRRDAFDQAKDEVERRWGPGYRRRVAGATVDPIQAEFEYEYAIENEVLCEARAGSYALGSMMKKLIPYVQKETEKWEKKWDATEHKNITLKADPTLDELMEFFGADFDDGFEDPYADFEAYNLPENANPMYSYLLKTVLAYKGDKLGASSVISYLRGRGVKAEEIKWSGVETFLEGKKSVTKNELADFLYENALVIEQETLGGVREIEDPEGEFINQDTGELFFRIEDAFGQAIRQAEAQGWDPDSVYTEDIDEGLWAMMGRDPSTGHDEVLFYLEGHYNEESLAESENHPRWGDYKTEGGENYREYLYKIPESRYANQAMKVHWNREGVLAHARVQDFKTSQGEKILFIDEIQSDWHNAGQKSGYATEDYDALLREQRDLLDLRRKGGWTKEDSDRYDEVYTLLSPHKVEAENKLKEHKKQLLEDEILSGLMDEMAPEIIETNERFGQSTDWETARQYAANRMMNYGSVLDFLSSYPHDITLTDEEDIRLEAFYDVLRGLQEDAEEAWTKDKDARMRPPEAPFSKNYHEFVLKTLLREAAENGYDRLAWTTANMQSERWSDEYAEGYRIEYDQDIPKFLNKYGKQWGARVGLMELSNYVNPDPGYTREQLRLLERDLDDWKRELELADNDDQREFIEAQIRYSEEEVAKLNKKGDTVWYIPITTEMRNSVLYEGQPMFNMPDDAGRADFVNRFNAMHGDGAAEEMLAAANAAFSQIEDTAPPTPASQGDNGMTGWVIYGRNAGAAALRFDPYTYLQNEYGTIEQTGKNNHRIADVPKSTNGRDKVSKTTATVMGAKATPDDRLGDIAQAVVDGKLSYYPTSNKIAENKARAKIRKNGYKDTLATWSEDVHKGKVNADLVAMGATLLNNAGNSEMDGRSYTRLMTDYAQLLRNAGQALQAANIFKKMSPEAKLYSLVRQVEEINARHNTGLPVSMWMDEVGELLADEIYKRVDVKEPRAKVKSVADTILEDLTKYARELVARESVSGAASTRTELERLQDMFNNKDKYEEAWQVAKDRLLDEFGTEPNIYAALEAWINSELTLADKLTKILTKQTEVVMPESLAEEYLAAETEEARDEVMERILQSIADQIPATTMDKFTALRYTGMLGNLRTNVRNVLGNSLMQPVLLVKNTFAGLAEALIQKSGVNIERTNSVIRDTETFKAALKEFEDVRDIIAGGGKYQDNRTDISQEIRKRQRIFKNAVLEGMRKGSGWLMENEYFGDARFSSFTYADALARYIAANGVTWSQASEELKEKARAAAVREAAEATYRDNNDFSEAVSQLRFRNPDTWIKKGFNIVGESLAPFRKTPANILVRSVEYSPIGLAAAMTQTVRKATNKSDVTAADLINSFSKGLTGTGIILAGMALASMGYLKGKGPDDEKEKELWEMQGHQEYALEVEGTSYTIDWASPLSIPLLVGAELHEALLSEGLTVREATGVVSAVFDPLLEMSMLQGINDAISNAQTYGDESALVRFVGNALWSYVTQPIPTLLGQVERSGTNARMTTYVDKNADVPDAVQRALGKASAKIPGWDYAQVQYIDAWGRTQQNADTQTLNVIEQFLSPGYANSLSESEMEKELLRLKQSTGDSAVLIKSAPKYFNVGGARKDLTADEYLVYAKTRGQTAFTVATDITENRAYAGMSDAERVTAIAKAYDYANQIAKELVTNGQAVPDKWVGEAQSGAAEYGIPVSTYLIAYAKTKDLKGIPDGEGGSVDNSKSLRVMAALYEIPGLSKEQIKKLAGDFDVNKTVLGYSDKMVKSKLEAMEKKYL